MYPLSYLRSHDLIHVHGIGAALDFVARLKWLHRRPIVLSTHGGIFHTAKLSGLKRVYFRNVVPSALRHVDVVAACSRSDQSLFATVSSRVVLLENAVDVRPYLQLDAAARQPGRLLYVGRLAENKGIQNLLRAAAHARHRGAEFQLRMIGPDVDNSRSTYERQAHQLGLADYVHFGGRVSQEELLREYAAASIFASASSYEGFGLSALEAKAAGCRLLLNRNDAFRCIFESDPAAVLVDFEDAPAAGAALVDLLQRPYDEALHSARREASFYSWERKMSEWELLYRQLVTGAD
jgi:alpha-1,3-mannosyltransferase